MNRADNIIKLLLIDDSVEDAEQLISVLRNGGIAVRPARAANEAELEAALEQHAPDLILADLACRDLRLAQVRDAAERGGRDIALIACGRALSEEAVVAAFHDGARALVFRDSHEHVQIIVRREFEDIGPVDQRWHDQHRRPAARPVVEQPRRPLLPEQRRVFQVAAIRMPAVALDAVEEERGAARQLRIEGSAEGITFWI